MLYQLDWRLDNRDFSNTDSRPRTRVPWTMGVEYNGEVPEPLICDLDPASGDLLRDIYLSDLPLFSNRTIEVLRENGVDNLQLFEGGVRTREGAVHLNYKAVNIIGLVSCADMDASVYRHGSQAPLIGFKHLVIDENRIGNHAFFRLYENSLYIIVNEKIKTALESADLSGFNLLPLELKK